MRTSKLSWFSLAALTMTLLCAGAAADRHAATSGSDRRARAPQDAGMPARAVVADAGHLGAPAGDAGTSAAAPGVLDKAEDAGSFKIAEDGGGPVSLDAGLSIESKAREPFSFPDVDELRPGDIRLDGPGYHALRVAMEDLLPPGRTPPPGGFSCLDNETNYHYQIQQRDGLYFIRIELLPERCNPRGVYVDTGVRYVVSADGRILRKRYDGQPD